MSPSRGRDGLAVAAASTNESLGYAVGRLSAPAAVEWTFINNCSASRGNLIGIGRDSDERPRGGLPQDNERWSPRSSQIPHRFLRMSPCRDRLARVIGLGGS
jgi:hypothetical protein